MDSNPSGVFSKNFGALVHGGDLRWATPSLDDVGAVTLDAVRAQIDTALAQAPIEIDIVGNVSVERAIEVVGATLGALPPRAAAVEAPPTNFDVHFPAATPTPVVLHHKGRADQAMAIVAWPTTDFFHDLQEARDVNILHDIFQRRLFDEFRTKIGATYSPGGMNSSPYDFPGYGYQLFYVETPSDKIPAFNETVAHIVADLKTIPVTDDELERLRKPRVEGILKAQETNEYWLGFLQYVQTDPRRLEAIRTAVPDFQKVTAESVQKAAQRYLRDDTEWRMEIVPSP